MAPPPWKSWSSLLEITAPYPSTARFQPMPLITRPRCPTKTSRSRRVRTTAGHSPSPSPLQTRIYAKPGCLKSVVMVVIVARASAGNLYWAVAENPAPQVPATEVRMRRRLNKGHSPPPFPLALPMAAFPAARCSSILRISQSPFQICFSPMFPRVQDKKVKLRAFPRRATIAWPWPAPLQGGSGALSTPHRSRSLGQGSAG